MWKKFVMAVFVLISILSLGNILFQYADTVHGFTPTFQLMKGDKVIFGEYNSQELVWDVGKTDANQTLLMSTTGLGDFPVYDPSIASSCAFMPSPGASRCPTTFLINEIDKVRLNVKSSPSSEMARTIDRPF